MRYHIAKKRILNFLKNNNVIAGVELAIKYNMLEEVSKKYLKKYVNFVNNDHSSLKQLRNGVKPKLIIHLTLNKYLCSCILHLANFFQKIVFLHG